MYRTLIATFLAFLCTVALAGESSFQGLRTFEGGVGRIAGEGEAIVGSHMFDLARGTLQGYVWTEADGLLMLETLEGGPQFYSSAVGTSDDTFLIAGESWGIDGLEGVAWIDGVIEPLGGLGGQLVRPDFTFTSTASDVAADGSVVVGQGVNVDGNFEAFVWTIDGGMVGLGDHVPGRPDRRGSGATAVSRDGSVIVGQCSALACVWKDGEVQSLGLLQEGTGSSIAHGVSPDGSVVVGQAARGIVQEGFVWSEEGGLRGIGVFEDADLPSSLAVAATLRGDTVVGSAAWRQLSTAIIWTEERGLLRLEDVLRDDHG
ncbi:MAG: hypothetical protein AAF488_14415, partial [Planctomycetota bacterium]